MKFQFGGGGFPGGGGGGQAGRSPQGRKDLFKDTPGVKELSTKSWKEDMEESASRRNIVVLFYESNLGEMEEVQEAFTTFVSKLVQGSALVEAGAVNCGRYEGLCHKQGARKLPFLKYYGPEGQQPSKFQGGAITYHSLSTWLPKVMADYVKVIVTERDLRRWLPTDDKAPHVLFFSDKKTTPPILKTLSIEFRERAAVGVVLLGSEELAKKLGVTKRPALVYIQDEETLTGEHFDKEFKKDQLARFLSRCVGRHRSQALASFRELTSSRLAGGDCAPGDSNFCLLLFSGHGDSPAMASLRTLAPRLRNDHVKVFFVKDAEFRSAFGSVPPGSVLLYRPKRRRFKLFEGDAGNIDDLAAWVDAAVGGGAPLPSSLVGTPGFQGEL